MQMTFQSRLTVFYNSNKLETIVTLFEDVLLVTVNVVEQELFILCQVS
jgi:hypothetical protein